MLNTAWTFYTIGQIAFVAFWVLLAAGLVVLATLAFEVSSWSAGKRPSRPSWYGPIGPCPPTRWSSRVSWLRSTNPENHSPSTIHLAAEPQENILPRPLPVLLCHSPCRLIFMRLVAPPSLLQEAS